MIWQWIVVGIVLMAVAFRVVVGFRNMIKRRSGPKSCGGCPLAEECGKNHCRKPEKGGGCCH
ncbi:MAG: hypothetical protein J6C91_08875 [Muribaculaceae bacterium]|nr:hypothetical protein [Muribaculaceae bacterium]